MAIASDFRFCDSHFKGNHAAVEARIRALIAETELKYSPVSCLISTPKYIEANWDSLATDPWVPNLVEHADEPGKVLSTIRSIWQAPQRTTISQDEHLLIIGWQDNTGAAGVAYLGGTES